MDSHELNSGLDWVDELFGAHLASTNPEQRRARLQKAEEVTCPEAEAFFGRPEAAYSDIPDDGAELEDDLN